MSQKNEDALLIEAGRMASRLIHDFKNQLGGMKLYAAYLKKRFADNPEGGEIADKIIQGLNEMAEQAALVAKLIRPIDLRPEICDPAKLIETVVNSLKLRAEGEKVKLTTDLSDQIPAVSIDLQQMQSALHSIVARAIASSPEHGEVKVSLRSRSDALEIEVRDQGDPPNQQKIDAFFDPLTNERINQASLGLALARRIIELHGGEVSAHAESPERTLVKVKLRS